MKSGLRKKTYFGFFWLLAGSSAQSILQILVVSILARLVTPEEFGIVSLCTIFLSFSKIISQLGMGAAIVQRLDVNKNHIRTAFTTSLGIGIVFFTFTIIGADRIADFFNMQDLSIILLYISPIFLIDSFSAVSQAMLQRQMKMKYYAVSDLISYLVSFGIIGVILANLGFGVYALVYAYIFQSLLRAVIVSIFAPHSIVPFWDKTSFNDLFFFGTGHTVAKIANYFAGEGDYLIVGKLLTASDLGFYSRAYHIMVSPVRLIGQSLNTILFPAMALVQNDIKKVTDAYFKSIEMVALFSLTISVVLIANAEEVVLILLGKDWLATVQPLQILTAGMLFRMSYKVSDSLSRALGDTYKRAIIQIVYALSVFIFSYVGHFWGIRGVATGVFFAILLNFLLMANLSLKQLNQTWLRFTRIHFKPFVLAIFVGTLSWLILSLLRIYINNLFFLEFIFIFILMLFTVPFVLLFNVYFGIGEEISKIKKIIKSKAI